MCIYVYVYVYVEYITETMMTDCTIKGATILRFNTTGFTCFCFQAKNLKSTNTWNLFINM